MIVSRGELIEIGDGFRIPEIMAQLGRDAARSRHHQSHPHRRTIGNAITERTRLILRVHPSNFRINGFTARPELKELVALGRERGIPVLRGSRKRLPCRSAGIRNQRTAGADSLAAGVNLVSFSCDKLLGGPQAGIIAGDAELIDRIRRNPMFRAFRLDKLIIQSLQITLRTCFEERMATDPGAPHDSGAA